MTEQGLDQNIARSGCSQKFIASISIENAIHSMKPSNVHLAASTSSDDDDKDNDFYSSGSSVLKPILDWNVDPYDQDSPGQLIPASTSPWTMLNKHTSRRLSSKSADLTISSETDDNIPPSSMVGEISKPSRWSWTESVDTSGLAELCQYVQQLETDKSALEHQVHALQEQEATRMRELQANERRINLLEASLADALRTSETFRHEKDIVVGLQSSERDRTAALVGLLEDAQHRYEEAERARQLAVFKLSALQSSIASSSSDNMIASIESAPSGRTNRVESETISERIEGYKREMELLRQKLALAEERTAEKQRIAVAAALRDADFERNAAIERVRLECETMLNEWKHDEAIRAKEAQAALEEDRYSIRLELKHAVQRAEIDQHVARLQADSTFGGGVGWPRRFSSLSRRADTNGMLATQLESEFSMGTLDEVLVRMQLELLRTRRFEALKKTLLIRRAQIAKTGQKLFRRWHRIAEAALADRKQAAIVVFRVMCRIRTRASRVAFGEWRQSTCEARALAFQARALTCWNRMLAAERLCHVLRVIHVSAFCTSGGAN